MRREMTDIREAMRFQGDNWNIVAQTSGGTYIQSPPNRAPFVGQAIADAMGPGLVRAWVMHDHAPPEDQLREPATFETLPSSGELTRAQLEFLVSTGSVSHMEGRPPSVVPYKSCGVSLGFVMDRPVSYRELSYMTRTEILAHAIALADSSGNPVASIEGARCGVKEEDDCKDVEKSDDMKELKPCPFCGSIYQAIYVDREQDSWIRCSECGVAVTAEHHGCSDASCDMILEYLVAKWNRRAEE